MTPKSNSIAKRFAVALLTAGLLGGAMTSCRPVEMYAPKETEPPKETATHDTDSPVATVPETTTPDTTPPETTAETDAPETEPPVLVSSIGLLFHTVSLPVGGSVTPVVTTSPEDAEDHSIVWTSTDPSVASVDESGRLRALSKGQCTITVTSVGNPAAFESVAVTVEDSPSCTYIDGILIANKTYPLPSTYALGVDSEAYNSLLSMISAAAGEGYSLWLVSGYRSYADQDIIYHNYVARDGQAEADRYSARPGHSEHQSGLAFDLNSLYQSFGDTAEGIRLAENCHRYGFIIRYPKEKESITGYMYEPWHVRYLGTELAAKVKESGLCLEEYLGITSSYEDAAR